MTPQTTGPAGREFRPLTFPPVSFEELCDFRDPNVKDSQRIADLCWRLETANWSTRNIFIAKATTLFYTQVDDGLAAVRERHDSADTFHNSSARYTYVRI